MLGCGIFFRQSLKKVLWGAQSGLKDEVCDILVSEGTEIPVAKDIDSNKVVFLNKEALEKVVLETPSDMSPVLSIARMRQAVTQAHGE